MLLRIKSNNPKFSHIISKNPNTIREKKEPFSRELRKGRVFGWFSEQDTCFSLLFIDNLAENSFGTTEGEVEYLDKTRYSHPYIPISIIKTALNTVATSGHPEDVDTEGFKTSVQFVCKGHTRILNSFLRMATDDFQIEYTPLEYSVYVQSESGTVTVPRLSSYFDIKITGSSVSKVLNYVQILCLILSVAEKDLYIPLDEAAIQKYIRSLNKINAPYYLRYLLHSRVVTSIQLFRKLEPFLNTENIKVQYGDTQLQRFIYISSLLSLGSRATKLVDIGSGEAYHSIRLHQNYEATYALEREPEVAELSRRKISKKGIDNIAVQVADVDVKWITDNCSIIEDSDVILVEVLEHNPVKVSEQLLSSILDCNPNKVVVTVPNKNFNKHYGIEDDCFRHSDHKWEPTKEEFVSFLDKVSVGKKLGYSLGFCGDMVEGEYTTLTALFHTK